MEGVFVINDVEGVVLLAIDSKLEVDSSVEDDTNVEDGKEVLNRELSEEKKLLADDEKSTSVDVLEDDDVEEDVNAEDDVDSTDEDKDEDNMLLEVLRERKVLLRIELDEEVPREEVLRENDEEDVVDLWSEEISSRMVASSQLLDIIARDSKTVEELFDADISDVFSGSDVEDTVTLDVVAVATMLLREVIGLEECDSVLVLILTKPRNSTVEAESVLVVDTFAVISVALFARGCKQDESIESVLDDSFTGSLENSKVGEWTVLIPPKSW